MKTGYEKIKQHQPVLIIEYPTCYKGIVLKPGKTLSLVRQNRNGIITERKVKNKYLILAGTVKPKNYKK